MAEERTEAPNGQNEQEQTQTPTLEQQLDEERKKSAEYADNWRRSAAEFSNYKRRVDKEKTEYSQYANAVLLAKLLEVMDGFDAAFRVIPEKFHTEPWVEGIRLTEQKLRRVLESEGVKPIEAQGKDFDPNYHEAMYYEPTPGEPEGRVIGEFQRGYTLGDRVLRPSRVKVAKGE
ncbi:MAG: nucleotide exchange factor GrpE [Anaerolineae bacterium]